MTPATEAVEAYYDAHVSAKLRDFVEGNKRVERAWETLERWAPRDPSRILEVGCGIGAICWRMSRRWPGAGVVGLDLSAASVAVAEKLFASPGVSFVQGRLGRWGGRDEFDLVVLMDVYEHIAIDERPALHGALKGLVGRRGRIFLSFPTPRHLARLRDRQPDQIQPVDEDVSLEAISALARDIRSEVLLYEEVDVWHEGDYAHAVLGRREGWVPAREAPPGRSLPARVAARLRKGWSAPVLPGRQARVSVVRERLGDRVYPGAEA